jgi:hypothetical protein
MSLDRVRQDERAHKDRNDDGHHIQDGARSFIEGLYIGNLTERGESEVANSPNLMEQPAQTVLADAYFPDWACDVRIGPPTPRRRPSENSAPSRART